jgi:hypothetical protein
MRAFALLAFAVSTWAAASDIKAGEGAYRFEELRLAIPAAFGEPHLRKPSLPKSNIPGVNFLKLNETGLAYAIALRASVIPKFSGTGASLGEQERDLSFVATLCDRWLDLAKLDITAFKRTPTERVTLDGHLALRATWTGMKEGKQYNGATYCMIIGAKAFDLEVVGIGERPDEFMRSALSAIDQLTIDSPK